VTVIIFIYSRLLYTVTADNEPSGVDPPMRVRRKTDNSANSVFATWKRREW